MLKSTIIRVFAFAALFAYALPFAFNAIGMGASFAFTGTIFSALAIGVSYMAASFALLVVWSLGMSPFKLTSEQRVNMWPWTSASVVIGTALCLLGAHLVPFFGLTVTGWIPALIGGGIACGIMAMTMFRTGNAAETKSES